VEVREEGARIRARAEEDAEEAKRREEARRQQAVQANLATTAANDALLKWKEDMRQREKEEEKRNAGEDLGTLRVCPVPLSLPCVILSLPGTFDFAL
jgi:hypothetical protein